MNYREEAPKRITNFDRRIDFLCVLRRLSHSAKSGNTCALKKLIKHELNKGSSGKTETLLLALCCEQSKALRIERDGSSGSSE